jgi:predicted P-loop ATPase/GTPase
MDRDALIRRLAETIAGDKALLLDGWTHLVLVSHIEADTPDMTGYCYTSDDRALAVAPKNFAIFDAIEQLRAAMAKADGKQPWTAALFASSARPASSPWNSNTTNRSAGP